MCSLYDLQRLRYSKAWTSDTVIGKRGSLDTIKVRQRCRLLEERQQHQPHHNNSSRSSVFFYSPLILPTVVALAQNQKRMMRIVHLDPDPANANTAGMNHDLQRAKRVFRVPPPAKDVVPAQPSMHRHSQTEYALAAASTESDDLSPPVLLRGPPDRTTSVRVSTR
jgi:hypothetical protein